MEVVNVFNKHYSPSKISSNALFSENVLSVELHLSKALFDVIQCSVS